MKIITDLIEKMHVRANNLLKSFILQFLEVKRHYIYKSNNKEER